MKDKNAPFNQLYVDMFNLVLRVEELSVQVQTKKNLTLGEMHTIEGIGAVRRTMTELAGIMNVTVSTLTVTIDRLVKKGYVKRERSEKDRRVVWISLTRQGAIMLKAHTRMHMRMVREAIRGLTDEQLEALDAAGSQIIAYFALEYSRLLEKQQANSAKKQRGNT